jgi:diadenosine tetraphosphate (Ap4A) HIT family hydrolase
VTDCPRTYVAQFAEKQGFAHVHFHVIPRAADLEPSLRGPRVFTLFDRRPISTDERDRVSASLRSVLV